MGGASNVPQDPADVGRVDLLGGASSSMLPYGLRIVTS
jgi:hypothetical protein